MAFTLRNLQNHSSSGPGLRLFTYDAGADTKATIDAANYFNAAAGLLRAGSVIIAKAADGTFIYTVASITGDVVVVASAQTLNGSKTHDWASLIDGATATTTVTVTGAALGDFAQASMSVSLQGMLMTAFVSAADTVTVVLQNETGGTIDLASGILRARVAKA